MLNCSFTSFLQHHCFQSSSSDFPHFTVSMPPVLWILAHIIRLVFQIYNIPFFHQICYASLFSGQIVIFKHVKVFRLFLLSICVQQPTTYVLSNEIYTPIGLSGYTVQINKNMGKTTSMTGSWISTQLCIKQILSEISKD